MKPRTTGKLLSALILGIVFTVAIHHSYESRRQMGREEFLAKQAASFDKHYAKPTPFIFVLIDCVLISGAAFGVYELVAFGVSKAVEKVGNREESS